MHVFAFISTHCNLNITKYTLKHKKKTEITFGIPS